MSTRNDAIQRTADKIRDIGSGVDQNQNVLLSDTEIGQEVDAAVIQYSLDQPREVVIDKTGLSSPYIDVSTLTSSAGSWIDGWSTLVSLESQAAAAGAGYTPSWLDIHRDIEPYRDTTKAYLYLKSITPVAADILRFRFTAPHTLSAVTDTIPTPHFDAVCDLAASYCCTRLAANYSKANDATVMADAVNYRDSQLRFRQTAEDFLRNYQRKVGVTEPGARPVTVVTDVDIPLAGGYPRLTHFGRYLGGRR